MAPGPALAPYEAGQAAAELAGVVLQPGPSKTVDETCTYGFAETVCVVPPRQYGPFCTTSITTSIGSDTITARYEPGALSSGHPCGYDIAADCESVSRG